MIIRLIFGLCFATLLVSCQTPLHEINYRGSLSESAGDVIWAGERFINVFVERSDFRVESRMQRGGTPKDSVSVNYFLRSSSSKRVVIYVTAYHKQRMIVFTIAGDFSSQVAVEAARTSERVFSELFPDSTYVPFQRYQGLFGP